METFEALRPRLFGIAYRMLGSAMAAEDIVQEAYLRTRDIPPEAVRAPKAYFGKVVTRLCLDELKTARERREHYFGEWLPEPVLTPDAPFERAIERESLSMAFLLLLETLSPAERAVFLLHDVFEYEYSDIADMLDKSEASCRQLLHRARGHVAAHRARFTSDPELHQALMTEFLAAVGSGDLAGLVALLTEDAVSTSDGGGKASAATRPLIGAEPVAQFIIGLARRAPEGFNTLMTTINGQPGVILRMGEETVSVLLFDLSGGRISRVYFVRNPDKLHLVRLGY